MLSKRVVGSMLLLVLLGALVTMTEPASAATLTPAASCGLVVTEDTVLTQDYTCDSPFPLQDRTLGGQILTVDLAGHTLTGTGYDHGGPADVHLNLKNGRLVNVAVQPRGLVENLDVASSTLVTGSGSAAGVRLTNSRLTDSRIFIFDGGAQIDHNRLRRSGISMSNTNRGLSFSIAWNDIADSPGPAVSECTPYFIQPNDVGGSIVANHISGSAGPAIQFCSAVQNLRPSTVAFNVLDHNAGGGIVTSGTPQPEQPTLSGGPLTIVANLTAFNGAPGIDARWVPGVPTGIVDGGWNVSLFNRGRCVGVRCALDFTSGHGFGFTS